MTPPDWNRLLLAYADGELGRLEHAHVERYLEQNPQAWDLLAELEETGPGNFDLWDNVEPPEPSDDDWNRRSHAISTLVPAPKRYGWKVIAISLAACVMAAVAIVQFEPNAPAVAQKSPQSQPLTNPDPLAEYAVLPVATAGEAMVSAVRGNGESGLVSVRSPLSEVLALATPDDIEIENPGSGEVTDGDSAMMVWPKK